MKKFTTLLFSYILQIIISAFIIMPIYSDEQKDYSIEHLKKEEIGNYVIGSLDETDITPKTWKSIHLAVKQGESKSYISLLRPLWWFAEQKPETGKTIHISMPEIGIIGQAEVLSIGNCPSDSRKLAPDHNIVIGKFIHENANVWELEFENENGEQEKLGVTAEHPIFSESRNKWIKAVNLKIGERVRTFDHKRVWLIGKVKKEGLHTVYNLEVHRSHTYHVSKFGILAHNNCVELGKPEPENAIFIESKSKLIKNAKGRFEVLLKDEKNPLDIKNDENKLPSKWVQSTDIWLSKDMKTKHLAKYWHLKSDEKAEDENNTFHLTDEQEEEKFVEIVKGLPENHADTALISSAKDEVKSNDFLLFLKAKFQNDPAKQNTSLWQEITEEKFDNNNIFTMFYWQFIRDRKNENYHIPELQKFVVNKQEGFETKLDIKIFRKNDEIVFVKETSNNQTKTIDQKKDIKNLLAEIKQKLPSPKNGEEDVEKTNGRNIAFTIMEYEENGQIKIEKVAAISGSDDRGLLPEAKQEHLDILKPHYIVNTNYKQILNDLPKEKTKGKSEQQLLDILNTNNDTKQEKVIIPRHHDTEIKIFSYALDFIKTKKVKRFILFSERPMCQSCSNVFKDSFIKIMENAGAEVIVDSKHVFLESKEKLLGVIQGSPKNIPQDTLDEDMNLRRDAVKEFIKAQKRK